MKGSELKKIEKIMAGIRCPKNYRCAESRFEHLCKAKDFGIEKYLDCLEDNPSECSFAIPLGTGFLCKCPVRVYLSKKLKK